MSELSDRHVRALRDLIDLPDLSGTKYKIVEKLAVGGMGTVYVAHDDELDRNVALKVLTLPDASGDLAARIVQEAQIVARLEHPNIVPIHDVGKLPDGRVYYVMKLVTGHTLTDVARESKDISALLAVFQRVCEGVAFAHTRGVIHRDLKPANVMVGQFGEVLIMDWGLAVRGNDAAAGGVAGTPAYMSPEQAAGDVPVDHLTDIYALGAMLYFLLTKHHPFDGDSPEAVRQKVLAGAPARPRHHNSSIARRLEAIALMAMARDGDQRYRSALELRDDIAKYLASEPVAAYRERWWEHAERWADRNKFILLVVATYVIVRFFIYFFSRP